MITNCPVKGERQGEAVKQRCVLGCVCVCARLTVGYEGEGSFCFFEKPIYRFFLRPTGVALCHIDC